MSEANERGAPLMDLSKIVDTQSAVIDLQASAINDLLRLLMQYITAEEANKLDAVRKINLAAMLKQNL